MEIITREATGVDKENILKLLNEVFQGQQKTASDGRNSEFWKWKYEDNVYENAVIHVVVINKEILACGTLWPFQFEFQGKILKGYQACDTVVSKKARGKGLFRKINEARKIYTKENSGDFIFNFPNENSLPGYLKMGWHFLGKIEWKVRVLQPLKVLTDISSSSQSKKMEIDKKYILKPEILEECLLNSAKDESLISLRSSTEYYLWRHLHHPTREYGMITLNEGNETASAVFHLMKKDSVIEMIILDFISSKHLFKKLLRKIVNEAKSLDASFIAFVKSQIFDKQNYLSTGFFSRKNKNFVCFPFNPAIKDDLLLMENWNLQATLHDSI